MAYKKLKLYFDRELLELLSDKIESINPNFDTISFQKTTLPLLKPLELKDRVKAIAKQLNQFLPGDYEKKLKVLVQILGDENPGSYGTFMDFFWTWPIGQFIESYGLDHEELSLQAIYELTKRGTGEFAIRPFIKNNPDHLLVVMHEWSFDSNLHVRRLSSEGLRPSLPWAEKMHLFIENPEPVFKILSNLKNDPEKYVQTSVANHLNDYLKLNHDFALNTIYQWSNSPGIHTKWIIKHAIRNYRKKNMPWAIELTKQMNS